MLIDKLRADLLIARKEKTDQVKIDLLRTLVGEAEMVGKNAGNRETTDSEVLAIVTKFSKNIKEIFEKTANLVGQSLSGDKVDSLQYELRILAEYLPQQVSEEDLASTINSTLCVGMGPIMKHLIEKFGKGNFDAGVARKLIEAKSN